jgi:hypothetical protein
MNILIAGASGLIGQSLIKELLKAGHTITALSRFPQQQMKQQNLVWRKWQNGDFLPWKDDLLRSEIIINLVGESIAGKRWSKKRKEQLLNSRVNAGRLFVSALKETNARPELFIQASAIGVYNPGQHKIDESAKTGGGFLADLTIKWEQSTAEIESMGIPRIILRIGLVLAADSLLIKKMLLPFKFFIGGPVGNGNQIMSWIHQDDLVDIILFLIEVKSPAVYNLTAPQPVSMKEFCKAFGQAVNRPSWFRVPAFTLKILYGKQMAEQTILAGDEVLPVNLQKQGYGFRYTNICPALKSLF